MCIVKIKISNKNVCNNALHEEFASDPTDANFATIEDTAMRNNITAGYPASHKQKKKSVLRLSLNNPNNRTASTFIILYQIMINLRITGLYNRGQQDEYVELEAAARCDLEGLMLVRYLYNAEGFPIYSQARLYEFPDTNLRKGNRVRLYSGFTKEKKVRTPEGVTYNFSWNLDTPIWDGNHVECYIMSPDERIGFAPCDPIEDHESPAERGTFLPLGEELGMSLAKAIVEGNVQVHDEALGFVPLKVTGVPEDEKVFFENGDFEGLLKHMQEKGEIGTAKPSKKAKKSKKNK